MIRNLVCEQGFEIDTVAVVEAEDFSPLPVTLWITEKMNEGVARELKSGIAKLKSFLQCKIVDRCRSGEFLIFFSINVIETFSSCLFVTLLQFFRLETQNDAIRRPQTKLMQAVDVVRRYMKACKYALFDGAVYKKAPEAVFTYVYCSSVSDFIHHILGNAEVADQIASFVQPLISLLSVKSCRIIEQMVIDYNYIEVQPKFVCFNIAEKRFVRNPKDLKGR